MRGLLYYVLELKIAKSFKVYTLQAHQKQIERSYLTPASGKVFSAMYKKCNGFLLINRYSTCICTPRTPDGDKDNDCRHRTVLALDQDIQGNT